MTTCLLLFPLLSLSSYRVSFSFALPKSVSFMNFPIGCLVFLLTSPRICGVLSFSLRQAWSSCMAVILLACNFNLSRCGDLVFGSISLVCLLSYLRWVSFVPVKIHRDLVRCPFTGFRYSACIQYRILKISNRLA